MKTLIAFTLIALSTSSFAALWNSNKDHSEILFQIPYMGVSEVTGRFNHFDAKAELQDDGVTFDSVTVEIQSSSIDTGIKMRDGHLKGPDFFLSQEHPVISFKSDSVKLVKGTTYLASGTMTLKGKSKPAQIEFTVIPTLKDTWGFDNKFVKFKSVLNRKDFGMNWNKVLNEKAFILGDEVSFWGVFQMQPSKSKTPNSKHMIPDTEYIRERDLERNNPNKKPDEEESSVSRMLRKLINKQSISE